MPQALGLIFRSLILVHKKQSAQTNVFFCDVIQPVLPIFFLGCQLTQLPLEGPYFLMLPVVGAFALNLGQFPAEAALQRVAAVVVMQWLPSL